MAKDCRFSLPGVPADDSYQRGFTLIELMVTVVIVGVLLGLGASSFRNWIGNMKIRTTAESIQNGLQLARAEAVRRNELIGFYLTSNLAASCQPSAAANWIVSFDDPASNCDVAPLSDAVLVATAPQPRILQKRSAAEASGAATVAAQQLWLKFNGLGRVDTTLAPNNPLVISIANPNAGNCLANGGGVRCLNVMVTTGGQIRMCDPQLTVTRPTDPQSC